MKEKDSTVLIQEKLVANVQLPCVETQENQQVLEGKMSVSIEHDADAGYILVDQADCHFNTGRYFPFELDAIIVDQYRQKYDEQESFQHPDFAGVQLIMFKKHEQKQRILLLNCARDCDQGSSNLPLLANALKLLVYYQTTHDVQQDYLAVIPVVDMLRGHFRLLTLNGHAVRYYDSRGAMVTSAASVVSPLLHALKHALQVMLQAIENQTEISASSVSTIMCSLQQFGKFPNHVSKDYTQYSDVVRKACREHFPTLPFFQHALGHQSWHDQDSCGPYVAAYAEQVAEESVTTEEPGIVIEEAPIMMRARFAGV